MADPLDVLAMDEIASHTGVDVRPVLAGLGDLARGLERVYGADGLQKPQDASSLDALEQAASGAAGPFEGDTVGDGLTGDSSSVVELGEADVIDADMIEADLSDDALEIEGGDLNEDSWAAFFDEAEDVDYTEDSAVISRDMQDRAISSILDAVDSESEDDSDDERKKDEEDSLKSLDEPLSRSQITGGIEPDLGAWEVDGALDGQQSKDYAKIGHLFVYSPEKAAAASEAEIVEEDGEDGEDKEEKKKTSKEEQDSSEEKRDEGKTPDEEKSGEKAERSGLGNEPSAAIINPLKKLKPKAKPVVEESSPEDELDDDELVGADLADEESEADDKTSVGGGFFESEDTLKEAEAPSESSQASEVSESEVDDDDDTSSNTAFGFGPASLLADESEAEPDESESDAEQEPAPASNEPTPDELVASGSTREAFMARLTELAGLDEESRRLIKGASGDDLIYAVVLALAQTDVLDVRDLMEYLKDQG
jgi:hypothetical protein